MPQSSSNAQSSCNCLNDAQTVAWGTDRPTSNSIILRMHIHILGKHTDSLLGPMNHWWVVHASGTINIQKQANQTRVTQFQCHSQPKKRIGHCWHPPKSEFDQASLVSQRWAQTAMTIILLKTLMQIFFPHSAIKFDDHWSRIAKALGRILVAFCKHRLPC